MICYDLLQFVMACININIVEKKFEERLEGINWREEGREERIRNLNGGYMYE